MSMIQWREEILNSIGGPWDLVVAGGGITGAGIFREATRLGLKVLLIDQRDFAWGTSSRSSKLVHGGFRYLKDGHILLTRASVIERERLLDEGPGLIDPMGFLLTLYHGDSPGRWTFEAGLSLYDLLALQWGHRFYSVDELSMLAPHISKENLEGGFHYGDAQTDDARLVFRLIQEAVSDGGTAINYVQATGLLLDGQRVSGVNLRDSLANKSFTAFSKVIVNATGAWADHLRAAVVPSRTIRPLRGSHLLFPAWRLPVAQAICFLHPLDRRPVFIFPWEGATIVGTTDVDHQETLDVDPAIHPEEVSYLMAAVESQFPSLNIGLRDVISTIAGVRPVVGTGKLDPSQESRDHVVWDDGGLITVTGGKLTTFRLLALDVLRKVQNQFPNLPSIREDLPALNQVNIDLSGQTGLYPRYQKRLVGRFGEKAGQVVAIAKPGELLVIPGTESLWVELRWAARSEYIVHLDDLLLRRVRIGLLLPNGGREFLPRIREICQAELQWENDRWEKEQDDYLKLWKSRYYLPEFQTIPDWKTQIQEAKIQRRYAELSESYRTLLIPKILGFFLVVGAVLGYLVWKRKKPNS